MRDLEKRLAAAIKQFWATRTEQTEAQSQRGARDQGSRGAVTGGAQLDGVVDLVRDCLLESGIPEGAIYRNKGGVTIPGFFRPTKEWDLLVIWDGQLVSAVEFKSQVGPSFGNNFNNRIEEALGSATDVWTAYREGAFQLSRRPWLGYFMLLEEAPESTHPVKVTEPHFRVLPEFRDSSYVRRYDLFCQKLMRERLYDAAAFLLSDRENGPQGGYREPQPELSFTRFATALSAMAMAFQRSQRDA